MTTDQEPKLDEFVGSDSGGKGRGAMAALAGRHRAPLTPSLPLTDDLDDGDYGADVVGQEKKLTVRQGEGSAPIPETAATEWPAAARAPRGPRPIAGASNSIEYARWPRERLEKPSSLN